MDTQRSASMTKKVIGALAFLALMTVFLVKVFSELALAADMPPRMPNLEAPAQILGTYRVKDIREKSKAFQGSVCARNYVKKQKLWREADENCGKYVWVVRTNNQLALLEADEQGYNRYYSFKIRSKECMNSVPKWDGTDGLFNDDFCRVVRARKHDTARSEVFVSYGDHTPKKEDALTRSSTVDRLVYVMTSVGGTTGYKVYLPKGVTVPRQITIEEVTTGLAFYVIPTDVTLTYTLERVGE